MRQQHTNANYKETQTDAVSVSLQRQHASYCTLTCVYSMYAYSTYNHMLEAVAHGMAMPKQIATINF